VSVAWRFLAALDGILDGVFSVFNDFLGIAKPFFCFARHLFVDAFGRLIFVTNKLPSFFLDFADKVFHSAVDLIFVHDGFPLMLSDWFRK